MTPSGVEPATFRFVTKFLNQPFFYFVLSFLSIVYLCTLCAHFTSPSTEHNTNIHASIWIQTRNTSKRLAADPRLFVFLMYFVPISLSCLSWLFVFYPNTYNGRLSMPPAGFEPAIPAILSSADPRLRPLCHSARHGNAPPRTSIFMYSRIKIRISCIIQRCLLNSSKKFVCLCGFCEH